MSIELSAVDEERFGVRTAKQTIETVDQLGATLAACRLQRVGLLILRVPTDAQMAVNAVERAGGLLMDTLCHCARRVIPVDADVMPTTFANRSDAPLRFRAGDARDADLVEWLAQEAFRGYGGHYRNDPRLRVEDAEAVYPSWARACCVDAVAPLVIAERGPRAVGFASLRRSSASALDVALFAVHPVARQQGVACSLLRHLIVNAPAWGASTLSYSTQITNLPMQRLLARAGFLPTRSVYTFHWWSDEPRA